MYCERRSHEDRGQRRTWLRLVVVGFVVIGAAFSGASQAVAGAATNQPLSAGASSIAAHPWLELASQFSGTNQSVSMGALPAEVQAWLAVAAQQAREVAAQASAAAAAFEAALAATVQPPVGSTGRQFLSFEATWH
jgi:PPE-repeat protein